MVALAKTVGLALLRARTATDWPAGITAGDVYVVRSGSVCEFAMVPTIELPPTIPLTSHVTLGSCAPVTVARNVWTALSASVAEEGDTEIWMEGAIETETEAAFAGSACGVATTCTVAGDGGRAGAVKTPMDVMVPHAAPEHPAPETLQEITRLGLELRGTVNTAENGTLVPEVTDDGPLTRTLKELVTVIAAAADFDGSAALVALTDTEAGTGRSAGAV